MRQVKRSGGFDSLKQAAILIDPSRFIFRAGSATVFCFVFQIQASSLTTLMPKFKPHKGLLKRVRITKTGKIKGRVGNGSHLRSGKSGKQLRNLAKPAYITSKGTARRVGQLLGRAVVPVGRPNPAPAGDDRSSASA